VRSRGQVPFCIVFTKIDARKKDLPPNAQNIRAFKQMVRRSPHSTRRAAASPIARAPFAAGSAAHQVSHLYVYTCMYVYV
jgi:hypothetical protein